MRWISNYWTYFSKLHKTSISIITDTAAIIKWQHMLWQVKWTYSTFLKASCKNHRSCLNSFLLSLWLVFMPPCGPLPIWHFFMAISTYTRLGQCIIKNPPLKYDTGAEMLVMTHTCYSTTHYFCMRQCVSLQTIICPH